VRHGRRRLLARSLGIAPQTVYDWFKGKYSPTAEKARALQAFLQAIDSSSEELLQESEKLLDDLKAWVKERGGTRANGGDKLRRPDTSTSPLRTSQPYFRAVKSLPQRKP
jgi:transcriptional regulator with XRE-family HTH domain